MGICESNNNYYINSDGNVICNLNGENVDEVPVLNWQYVTSDIYANPDSKYEGIYNPDDNTVLVENTDLFYGITGISGVYWNGDPYNKRFKGQPTVDSFGVYGTLYDLKKNIKNIDLTTFWTLIPEKIQEIHTNLPIFKDITGKRPMLPKE
jgi:hypothetical protein